MEHMPDTPLATDGVSQVSGQEMGKRSFKQRALDEAIRFSVIVFYLWVMFATFALHESVVTAKDHINYHFYGFALVNALILGKVMLVAEDLHFADWFKDRPLISPILCKAVAFSILFLVADVVEEVVVGLFKGRTIAQSIPDIGGGGLSGVIFVAIILAVALTPFFAFREIGRVLGERTLHAVLFTEGATAVFQSGERKGDG
jgi:hypothetical protein